MNLCYKSTAFDVKAMGDDGSGSFDLYASVFGNVDRHGEIVTPNAFKNLDEFVASGWGAVNHTNYGPDLGIAMIDEATQDAIGLRIKGRFHSTADAQSVRTKIRERMAASKAVKCSFGYEVLDATEEMREGKRVVLLKALNIHEFSFVNSPANPKAEVVGMKSDEIPRLSDVKSWISEAKAGRTLSAATLAKLRSVYSSLDPACKELGEFIAAYDRDESEKSNQPNPATLESLRRELIVLGSDPHFRMGESV